MAALEAPTSPLPRLVSLDRLRGLAVALMLFDHVLGQLAPESLLRYTITRAALPLFMLVAGWLLAHRDRPSWRRISELVAAATLSTGVTLALGMPQPDVLVLFLCVLPFWPLARRWPYAAVVVCAVIMATFPVPWRGYHPAELLLLLSCGALIRQAGAVVLPGVALPAWLAVVGRWPLVLYVGHLLAILAAVRLGASLGATGNAWEVFMLIGDGLGAVAGLGGVVVLFVCLLIAAGALIVGAWALLGWCFGRLLQARTVDRAEDGTAPVATFRPANADKHG